MNEKKMLETADLLKNLRDKKDSLQDELKAVQAQIDEAEATLVELMTTEECTGFDRSGFRFSLVIREYPGAIPEEKEELYEQMRTHGFNHLFTINPMTLQGTLKELKANNDDIMPEWLDGLVKVYEKAGIRVTKSK